MTAQQELELGGDNALTVREASLPVNTPPIEQPRGALADLRARSMSVPVPVMQAALAEYTERRKCFRDWLMSQLVEGLHYGIPPGCLPKIDPHSGWYLVRTRGGGEQPLDPKQWVIKPTMYAAGADFITDLMGLIDRYESDMGAWEQLGKPEQTFVRRCLLYSRATNELIGEGTGCRKVTQNDGKPNDALKMAEKSAKISAILNAYGLRDLFTQPSDDSDKPRHENPPADGNAPKTQPRGERVTEDEIKGLLSWWRRLHPKDANDPQAWASFVYKATGNQFDHKKASKWTMGCVNLVNAQLDNLERETGGIPF